MRKRLQSALLIIAVLFMGSFVHAYGEAFSPEKDNKNVKDILSEFPVDRADDLDRLASDLINLGKKGLVRLCLYLESPVEKDRIKAQYALHGLAVHSAKLSNEDDRFLVSKTLIKVLKSLKGQKAQEFIISQLQLVGKREAVKPIARFLVDPKLCEPAARALLSFETERAEKAFIKSLDSLSGSRRITVIKALGELQSQKAVKKIKPFVSSEDEKLRLVSLYALANIGDPSCLSLLGKARIRSSPYERSRAPFIYLLYIQRLSELGYKKLSVNICRDLIKNYTAEDETQVRCAALDLLANTAQGKALNDLLRAVESPDRDFRQKALGLAVNIYQKEMKENWKQKMEKVSPEVQAEILTMLGRTGDESLLDFFRRKLHSEHPGVRMAVIIPLSRWGKEKVMDDLFELLHHNKKQETQLIKQVLLGFDAESIIPRIQREFNEMPSNARTALIQVMAKKRAFSCADLILSQVQSHEEDLRRTALSHLERVVDESDVSALITLLKEAQDPREISWLQKALEKACQFISDSEKRAEKVLAALEEAEGSKKRVFLRPLSEIGGNKALDAVLENLEKEDPEIRTEAFYTLIQWKSIEASDELLLLGKKAKDKKQRYLSLKSYIQVIVSSELEDKKKLEMLMEAKTIPEETDEEKLFLSGLGQIKTLGSMEQAAQFLPHEELQKSAANIIARIALPEPLREGLRGDKVIFLLKEALEFIENEHQREQILEYIDQIKN